MQIIKAKTLRIYNRVWSEASTSTFGSDAALGLDSSASWVS